MMLPRSVLYLRFAALALPLLLILLYAPIGCMPSPPPGDGANGPITGSGTATIFGLIVNAEDTTQPVSDAYVYVPTPRVRARADAVSASRSGSGGAYRLQGVPAGPQSIIVTPPEGSGFAGIEIGMDVPDGAEIEFRITLVPPATAESITSVIVDPKDQVVLPGNTLQFRATVIGESSAQLALAPMWLVTNQVGTIDEHGQFTASSTPGTGTVVAVVGGVAGSATVTSGDENEGPEVTLSVTPSIGQAPLDVIATASASDADGVIALLSINWGDGTDPTTTNAAIFDPPAEHTYIKAGNYTVTATATDDSGATGTSVAAVRAVLGPNTAPTCRLTVSPSSGLAPLDVSFTASGDDADGAIALWRIDFGDGTDAYESASMPDGLAHTYQAVGNYEAVLTVTDDRGGQATASASIQVYSTDNRPPSASLTASPTTGEAPLSVSFTGSGSDPDGSIVAYALDFGDGATPWQDVVEPSGLQHVYASEGVYTARLTVTDDKAATGSQTLTITVTSGPVLDVAPLTIDLGTTSSTGGFSVFNSGGGTLNWTCIPSAPWLSVNPSSGTDMGTVTVTVDRSAIPAGSHTPTVLVESNGGSATVAVTLTVSNHAPVISSLVATPSGVEPGGTATITATASDVDPDTLSYAWSASFGTLTGSGSQVTWTAPNTVGQCVITCSVSDGNGGSATRTVNVEVSTDRGDLGVDVD